MTDKTMSELDREPIDIGDLLNMLRDAWLVTNGRIRQIQADIEQRLLPLAPCRWTACKYHEMLIHCQTLKLALMHVGYGLADISAHLKYSSTEEQYCARMQEIREEHDKTIEIEQTADNIDDLLDEIHDQWPEVMRQLADLSGSIDQGLLHLAPDEMTQCMCWAAHAYCHMMNRSFTEIGFDLVFLKEHLKIAHRKGVECNE